MKKPEKTKNSKIKAPKAALKFPPHQFPWKTKGAGRQPSGSSTSGASCCGRIATGTGAKRRRPRARRLRPWCVRSPAWGRRAFLLSAMRRVWTGLERCSRAWQMWRLPVRSMTTHGRGIRVLDFSVFQICGGLSIFSI